MQLRLLMLANSPTGGIGVDLDTGSLVRARWNGVETDFAPYDVVEAERLSGDDLPFPADMVAACGPAVIGRMTGRRAERVVKPLVQPTSQPLFGAATTAVTYWTLRSDAPSAAIVAPASGPVVERDKTMRLRCRFRWRRLDHDLPLEDARVEERLSHPTATTLAGATLARALGWKPDRVLVALRPPVEGICDKVVAGLLPRP